VLGDAEPEVNTLMEELHGNVGAEDFAAVIETAEALRQTLSEVVTAG